jgi:hypothetical protein
MPSFSTAGRSSTSRWNRSGARAAMRAAVSAKYCGVQKLAGVSTRYLQREAVTRQQQASVAAILQSLVVSGCRKISDSCSALPRIPCGQSQSSYGSQLVSWQCHCTFTHLCSMPATISKIVSSAL